MPRPIEVSRQAPGMDPDTAPDNMIQRNTNEVRRLAKVVGELNEQLIESQKSMVAQTDRLEQQAAVIHEGRQAIADFSKQMRGDIGTLNTELKELRGVLEKVAGLLEKHTDTIAQNSEALRRASRF